MNLANGLMILNVVGKEDIIFSQNYSCPEHDFSMEELSPRMFSFNSPFGACKKCTGLGVFLQISEDRVVPNRDLSINQGAIKASGWAMEGNSIASMYFKALSKNTVFP